MRYIHLNVHSTYSLGESSLSIKDMVKFAKAQNIVSLALTDTNNMFGVREFSVALAENGIKPIIGVGITVLYKSTDNTPNIKGKVTLLAKDKQGYLNLLNLHSQLYTNNHDLLIEPYVEFANLLECKEGLILLTGGNEGFLAEVLLTNNKQLIEQLLVNLKNAFSNDLYIELQRFNNTRNLNLEDNFLQIAGSYNLPIVATNKVFFKEEEDSEATDIVICIGEGTTVNDESRKKLSEQQYLKTEAEMVALFSDLPESLENTIKIAQKCNFLVERIDPKLPSFVENNNLEDNHNANITAVINESELLASKAKEGLTEKLKHEVFKHLNDLPADEQEKVRANYQERLNYELDVINKMGFAGYFLIVADFINWAKDNDIPVGPGRGSGAGSLVAFVLRITTIDPLRFNLIFERFLNPERVSMPDFDIDFCQRRRDEVISYVSNKYGANRVAKIITFGSLQTRAAIRDVGRSLGLPYIDVDRICKRIPHSAPTDPITIEKALKNDPKLAEDINNNYMLKKLFTIALKLEGIYRNVSTHAAGIVIGYLPLNKIIPLYKDEAEADSLPVAGFSMKYIEDTGLVKFDFLGLKTLTVIKATLKQIKSLENIDIDIDNIELSNDQLITELLSTAKTLGVFQLESTGMREVLKQMMPDKIEDITAIISLYRPGPMENIPSYINRKHGKEKINYLHDGMKEILNETFGIMIYQEQVMQIAQKLGNYTLGGADLLRRAMGKKKPEEMAEQQSIFINGAAENNIKAELATKIFDQIAKFAGYGFNKSHAAAYAVISWQTAYLKAHYTAAFIAESMTYDMQDTDKLLVMVEDAKAFNIKVLAPNINYANSGFTAHKNNNNEYFIRYSLLAVKGISKSLVEFISTEVSKNGNFTGVEDFLVRTPKEYVNKKQLEALIKSGSFDELEQNRNQLLEQVEAMLLFNTQINSEKNSDQIGLFGDEESSNTKLKLQLKIIHDFNLQEKLLHEASVIGFFISSHPLSEYERVLPQHNVTKYRDLVDEEKEKATLAVMVMKIKISKTRNNDRFATLTCTDTSAVFNIVLFGKSYEKFGSRVSESNIYLMKVASKFDNGEVKLFVEEVTLFDENAKPSVASQPHYLVEITVPLEKQTLNQIAASIKTAKTGDTAIFLNLIIDEEHSKKFNLNSKITYNQAFVDSIASFAKIELKKIN